MPVSKATGGPGLAIEHVPVLIPAGAVKLEGDLSIPTAARGVVLFAHGSGSSRRSPRNRYVADILNEGGLATLLIDLLTADENQVDMQTAHLRFDIGLLAGRLISIAESLESRREVMGLKLGLFGASTGAGAALVAAAKRPKLVHAVVSRGGRPDLAGSSLGLVKAPTLMIVGGADDVVLDLNRKARMQMECETALDIVPGAGHLFERPEELSAVARLAREWFLNKLV